MTTPIYINLPVQDLQKSTAFFSALGYGFDARFTNDQAACMVIDPGHVYVMLLVKPFFQGFLADREIADSATQREAILCVGCNSREEVQGTVAKAVAAGASTPLAAKDYGFMYQHGFDDLDGHQWEYMWMDPNAPMLQEKA